MTADAYDLDTMTEHLNGGGDARCECEAVVTRRDPGVGFRHGERCDFEVLTMEDGWDKDAAVRFYPTAQEAAAAALSDASQVDHRVGCDSLLR